VDKVGHVEATPRLAFKIDATAPVLRGMPGSCAIWPPNDKMVQVGTVTASDALSGVASGSPAIIVNSNEPLAPSDVGIEGGVVHVRATRQGAGDGRVYSITAEAADLAGNTATAASTCLVPHDQSGR
jgi:hypothetical protein